MGLLVPDFRVNDYVLSFKASSNAGRAFVFIQQMVPVVSDFIPEACQILREDYSGYVVHSREGWYEALEMLIVSPGLRTTVADNARRELEKHYAREKLVDNAVSFFANLIQEKEAGRYERFLFPDADDMGQAPPLKRPTALTALRRRLWPRP